MTPLAMPAGTVRRDVLRWGLCFAAVAAAHAAAAMALLYTPASSDADFMAGAAVEVVDLPQTPAATPRPPTDLPPGPEEVQPEDTPPPKEETKPPEETAEVALPEPEPPKPEPPIEQTAPPEVMAVPSEALPTAGVESLKPQPPSPAVLRWQSGLQAQIARFRRYPPKLVGSHEEGRVLVRFTIDRNGKLLESRVLESSGSPDFDQEALLTLTRARPLPKPPADMKEADLEVTLPINFVDPNKIR
jgi:periplasmic protein TonB